MTVSSSLRSLPSQPSGLSETMLSAGPVQEQALAIIGDEALHPLLWGGIDRERKTLWCSFRTEERPCFSPALLRDMRVVQGALRDLAESIDEPAFRYVVVASAVPGVFNLGGDLALFSERIRARDREGLRRYAHACVDVVFENADGYGGDLTTVALVAGDALGGGFEAALACHVIVAEKQAKFGLPEVLFNLFPGMGAYSLLKRRVGSRMAEKLILSGQVYTATELHEMGIVDVLAETGEGETAVREHLARLDRRYNTHRAIGHVRRRIDPVSHQELRDVTDLWVDAAMRLTDSDLRKMRRLINAQNRLVAKTDG